MYLPFIYYYATAIISTAIVFAPVVESKFPPSLELISNWLIFVAPLIGKTIGGSVTAISNATGGIEIAGTVTNFSSGTPTYTSLAADGTKVVVGAEATVYDGMFIKHTGFTDTNLNTRTYEYIACFVEHSSGAYTLFATIPSGGVIFLPNTPNVGSGLGYYVAASNNVAGGTSATGTVLSQLVTIT